MKSFRFRLNTKELQYNAISHKSACNRKMKGE